MPINDRPTVTIPSMNRPGRPAMGSGGMGRFAPHEKPKDVGGTFRKLLQFYMKESKSLLIVIVLIVLDILITVTAPYLMGRAIDLMKTSFSLSLIEIFVIAIAAMYLVDGGINVLQGVLMNKTTQKIVRRMRATLFDKLQKLPLTYHDTHTHGELMSRLTNDVDNISVTIAQSTTSLIGAVGTIIGSVVIMFVLNVYLALAVLVTVPLIFIVTKIVAKHSKELFVGQQRELGKLNGLIEESISGQKMVKAFNMEEARTEQFDKINAELRKNSVKAQIWSGVLMPMMNVITNFGYVLVGIVGGVLAVNGMTSVGTITSFTVYSRQFTGPLNNIAGMFNNLQSALAGAERIFEILAEDEEPADSSDAIEMKEPKGEVRFDGVSFAYVPGINVLHDVSFSVIPGQKIALVGPTGAGKTTIVNLLTRFYDVSSGEVVLDDKDIRDYKRDSLRSTFSVVLQDTCLFTGTIADNIRYGRPEASEVEVEEAARVAGADEFIKRLKDGYNTIVSGESDTLSQGQRQLLAIARAVLCRAPILILDEATSSVDTRTELSIQKAMLELSEGRTSFVIAHRLSTIKDADVIMVVMDGRIVESGSHNELMRENGVYARMYNSQFE